MEPGVYEIESKSIFAIIQEYNTKEIKDCVLEGVIYRYSIYNSGC
jgi:beta-galactosidase beta subunit